MAFESVKNVEDDCILRLFFLWAFRALSEVEKLFVIADKEEILRSGALILRTQEQWMLDPDLAMTLVNACFFFFQNPIIECLRTIGDLKKLNNY